MTRTRTRCSSSATRARPSCRSTRPVTDQPDELATGAFDDTEGLTYVGGGKFVLVEERVRQVNLFTYVAGGTLTRAAVQTVKLANTVGNIGIEGVSNDPLNAGGLIGVKEKTPEGIFATVPNWAAGTASNGSPTADNPADLFDPALAGLPDFSDVYAAADGTLLILSQEGGRIVDVSRSGQVLSALNIVGDADNPLQRSRPGPRGRHDGPGRAALHGQRAGRRREQAAAVGLRARPRSRAERDAHQRRHVAAGDDEHGHAREGRRRHGHRRQPEQPARDRRRRELVRGRRERPLHQGRHRAQQAELHGQRRQHERHEHPADDHDHLARDGRDHRGRALGLERLLRRRLVGAHQHRHGRARPDRLQDGRQLQRARHRGRAQRRDERRARPVGDLPRG